MEIKFEKYSDTGTWIENIQVNKLLEKFKQDGYGIIKNFISEIDCLNIYQDCVSKCILELLIQKIGDTT